MSPTSIYVKNEPNGRLAPGAAGEKRMRDDRMDEDAREVKRERTEKEEEDDDDEEMEIEDDDEGPKQGGSANGAWPPNLDDARTRLKLVGDRTNTNHEPAAVSAACVPQPSTRGHGRRISGPVPTVRPEPSPPHPLLMPRNLQVPRIPLRASRPISNTKRVWTESQDGIRDVRLTRSRVRCKRSLGRLRTQEGMGDVCFVYLALYPILCNMYLSILAPR